MLALRALVMAALASTAAAQTLHVGGYMKARYKLAFTKFSSWATVASHGYTVDITKLTEYTTLNVGPAINWQANITSWTTNKVIEVVICPYTSSATKLCADAVHSDFRGPVMVWGGAADSIFSSNCIPTNMPFDNCFGFFTKASVYMTSGLEALASTLGPNTQVSTIANNNAFSASVATGAETVITNNANLTMLGTRKTLSVMAQPLTSADETQIVNAMNANPDVVVIAGHNLDVEPIIIKIGQQSNTPKAVLATNSLTYYPANYGSDSKYGKCVMMPTQWEKSTTATDPAMGLTKAQFETHMGSSTSVTYQEAAAAAVGVALANALKLLHDAPSSLSGSALVNAENIKTKLASMNVNSFYGTLAWTKGTTESGAIMKPMYTVQQLSSGETIVAPTGTNNMISGTSVMQGATCWDKSSTATQTSGAFHGRFSMLALFVMILGSSEARRGFLF